MSFRLLGLRFDSKSLNFARSIEEKTAVYALCGVQPFSKSLQMAREIAGLEPNNPWIKVIVSREINRNEVFFRSKLSDQMEMGDKEDSLRIALGKTEASGSFADILIFTSKMAKNPKAGSKAFWLTATAYMEYLVGDINGSEIHLNEAKKEGGLTPKINQQIATQELLLMAANETWVSPMTEKRILDIIELILQDSVYYHINARNHAITSLANLYLFPKKEKESSWWKWSCSAKEPLELIPQDAFVKSFMLRSLGTYKSNPGWGGNYMSETCLWDMLDTTSASDMHKVVDFLQRKHHSENDKQLIRICKLDVADVCLWTARRYMVENQYAKAAELFKQIDSDAFMDAYGEYSCFRENPFNIKVPGEVDENPYTAESFALRMARLETESKTAVGDSAAEKFYQLGCGAYNLTWQGNAWILVKAWWSVNQGDEDWQYLPDGPTKTKEIERRSKENYLSAETALGYFEKAAKTARNPELKAKANYMAARCVFLGEALKESKRRASFSWEENNKLPDKADVAMKSSENSFWMTVFRKENGGTQFHKMMMKECSLYADFFTDGNEIPQ